MNFQLHRANLKTNKRVAVVPSKKGAHTQSCFLSKTSPSQKKQGTWFGTSISAFQDCYASLAPSHWRRCDLFQLSTLETWGDKKTVYTRWQHIFFVWWSCLEWFLWVRRMNGSVFGCRIQRFKQQTNRTEGGVDVFFLWKLVLLDPKVMIKYYVCIYINDDKVDVFRLKFLFFVQKRILGWLQQRTSLFDKRVVSNQCSSFNIHLVMFWFNCVLF